MKIESEDSKIVTTIEKNCQNHDYINEDTILIYNGPIIKIQQDFLEWYKQKLTKAKKIKDKITIEQQQQEIKRLQKQVDDLLNLKKVFLVK